MENYSFDLIRIFFGEAPPIIYLEIIIRTLILYGYTVALMRVIPQRNLGELSQLDIMAIIALGSAVGDPMFYPNVPILHGILVITLIFIMRYGLTAVSRLGTTYEFIVEGDPIRVVVDGLLDLDGMQKANITREDVFMQIRMDQHDTLADVQRAYVETSGKISVLPYKPEEQKPYGLPIVPPRDIKTFTRHQHTETAPTSATYGCYNCGYVETFEEGSQFVRCPRCQESQWLDLDHIDFVAQTTG